MFPNKTKSKKMRYILNSIDENMKKYMFMKTFVSAMTAILSYFWLHYIGVEFAGVWAFIIFVMNYIPTFGSIVACTLPILYALITSDGVNLPILTASGLIALQFILGNLLEPKLTGKTLNLSTLAILINLVFWGMLWGVGGMFFSVPLLVATFIITAQFDSTRWVAVLLSANGEIPEKKDED
jgi:predicted PurR-regulated permease PerM